MEVNDFQIEGLLEFYPKIFKDERGFFMETFNCKNYEAYIGNVNFVQDNISTSKIGVLRGLHYQENNAQGKLVRVVKGSVLDVAVDLRKNSKTFGISQSVILTEEKQNQFWIPEGFAHGFLVLSDEVIFEYKCTNYYDPTSERSLLWNDLDVDIDWKLDKFFDKGFQPILSSKDKNAKTLKELFS